MEHKSFDDADEVRRPDKAQIEIVRLGDVQVGRSTFQPGWRWSESVKPIAGTDTCQARHVGAVVSGRLHVVQDDGTEGDLGPGDAYVIDPGHDAWVVGDEPCVGLEFESQTVRTYAAGS